MLRSAVSPSMAVNRMLFVGRNLNFQSTADQALTRLIPTGSYRITDIFAVRRTGAASVTCAGGIYDAASKGGNAVVGVAQSWVTLASGVIVVPTLAALVGTTILTSNLFLSLTTGSTAAVTADVFVFGYVID
jgi:hypothetical protein